MPGKGGDYGSKAANAIAGAAATFVVRKALSFGWTKVTGRKPPEKPDDPRVALTEALTWTVLVAVCVAVARVLAVRLATEQSAKRRGIARADYADRSAS